MGSGGGKDPEYVQQYRPEYITPYAWFAWGANTQGQGDTLSVDFATINTRTPNLYAALYNAYYTNPYASAAAYDPSAELDRVKLSTDGFVAEVEEYSPESLYTGSIDIVNSSIDTVMGDSDELIGEALTSYDEQLEPVYNRRLAVLVSTMQDAHALDSSAFALAVSNLMADKNREVSQLGRQLKVQLASDRARVFAAQVQQLLDLYRTRIEAYRTAVLLVTEYSKMVILGRDAQIRMNIEYDFADVMWEVGIMDKIAAIPTHLANLPPTMFKPTPLEQFLSALGGSLNTAFGVGMATKRPEAALATALIMGSLSAATAFLT